MAMVVDEATKPFEIDGKTYTLEQRIGGRTNGEVFLSTSDFIRESGRTTINTNLSDLIGIKADSNSIQFPVTSNVFDDGFYEVPSVDAIPSLLDQIRKRWGNGIDRGTPEPKNKNAVCNNIQQWVFNKRSEVQNDFKEREKFLKALKTISHNSPLYLCRKWILNQIELEGIHYPWSPENLRVKACVLPGTPDSTRFSKLSFVDLTFKVPILEPQPIPEPVHDFARSEATTQPPVPAPEPVPVHNFARSEATTQPITILSYSPRSIIVIGATKPFKEQFKTMWGRWSVNLKHPVTGEKLKGWVFSSKRTNQIQKLIANAA
jgi:hypothetical protein